jgi:hypothetical protein
MQVLRRRALPIGIANRNRQSLRGDIVIRFNAIRVTVMVGVLVLVLQSIPVRAQADSGASEAGLGTAAAVSSLIYGPIKMAYSTLGLVFGAFAWGLSGGDAEVLEAVVTPAVRGDYVITPSHLRGEKTIEFIGRQPDYREEAVVLEEAY